MNNRKSFIVGIKSTTLNNAEKNFIKRHKPWGFILFTRNIKNIIQTKKLTTSIRNIFNDKKYPILIDQEGGRVNRLKNLISFDTLTSEYFGKLFLSDKRKFYITYKLYIDQGTPTISTSSKKIDGMKYFYKKYKRYMSKRQALAMRLLIRRWEMKPKTNFLNTFLILVVNFLKTFNIIVNFICIRKAK